MDVDGPAVSDVAAAASDSLSEYSSGEYSVGSDGGAAASAESTAEENPAIYVIQDMPRNSQHPVCSQHMPRKYQSSVPCFRRSIGGPNRRFTHSPVRRMCETHPRLHRVVRRNLGDRSWRRLGRCGYMETLFELPYITDDNVIIFSKPQKLKRSVDEVDQLMKKLVLRKEKTK